DMSEVLRAAAGGEADAALAVDVYAHRLCAGIASMAAALGGLEVIAFTGGVGENAATIRSVAADRLRFLGLAVDRRRNEAPDGDVDVSADGATVRVLVIRAREDLEIARQVRRSMSGEARI